MDKNNCWDILKCGRADDCPSAKSGHGDGMHGGKNRGRFCWTVKGTFCDNEAQGDFVQKIKKCMNQCEFYPKVETEEGSGFVVQ